MDEIFVQGLMVESIRVTMLIGAPIMISSMIVGLVISILQATTSIQEQTLTFVPKVIAIALSIIIFGPWMLDIMKDYSLQIFNMMSQMGRP